MKNFIIRNIIFISILATIFIQPANTFASDINTFEDCYTSVGSYLKNTVTNPDVASIGGEWSIIGLARSGLEISEEYFNDYYKNVEDYVKEKKGILHDKKYTEYSRVVLSLSAIGKNPENVAGFNLLTPLGDYEKTVWQGVNGAFWALIALDSKNYEMPLNPSAKVQATRQMYINHILERQNTDGGWSLSGEKSDADVTAMALQSLSKYQNDEKVKAAIEKALFCLSKMQNENGGFSSSSAETSESSAQVLVALSELKISFNDERFIKNGNTVLDSILSYYDKGNGFLHTKNGSTSDLMATEQCFYGLVAAKRFLENKNSLYSMSDSIYLSEGNTVSSNAALEKQNKITFTDITEHKNKEAIENLASIGVINGKYKNNFAPDDLVTRAEFAAIIVRAFNLKAKSDTVIFDDVSKDSWFFTYVNTAYENGITNGISESKFNPNGNITREETATMLERTLKLCGINTDTDTVEIRNTLAGFVDYITASEWALKSLSICYKYGIFDDSELEIKPQKPILRCETAQSVYNLMKEADML